MERMSRIMKYKNYHEQKDAENIQRLREVLTTLPSFVSDYFRATEMSTSTTTRLSYAYDIRIFFRFLVERNPMYKHYTTADFTYEDLDKLQAVDIEEYKEYLKLYQKEEHYGEVDITNGERGMKRKMSALRSLFTYLYRYELIQNQPCRSGGHAQAPRQSHHPSGTRRDSPPSGFYRTWRRRFDRAEKGLL